MIWGGGEGGWGGGEEGEEGGGSKFLWIMDKKWESALIPAPKVHPASTRGLGGKLGGWEWGGRRGGEITKGNEIMK